METKNDTKDLDTTHSHLPTETKKEDVEVDGEFKVTVRKLEIPVRPRGVLAE